MNSHEIVIHRNLFYRKLSALQLGLLFFLLLGIGVNLFFIHTVRSDQARPTYFMTDRFGKTLPQPSLAERVYSDQQIEEWATKKINLLDSMNFMTHKQIVNQAAAYFNPQGYTEFLSALKRSRNIEALNAYKYVAVIDIEEPLKVSRTVYVDGGKVFAWILKGKYKISYFNNQNKKNPFIQEKDYTILVRRESFTLYEDGLSIVTIIA